MGTGEHIASRKRNADRLDIIYEHGHSESKCYPTLANGVAVLGGIAWTLGNFVEIIPVNTITKDFDIHFISIEGLSAVDTYEIVLYAAETEISRVRVARTANQDSTTQVPIQTPMLKANTQIQAKSASSGGGDTAIISLHYHEY